MKPPVMILLACVVAFFARAESTRFETELGEGLGYVRAHSLPDDLPATKSKPSPLVLDLRYTRTDDAGVTALSAWLQFRASLRNPVFVLVNSSTAAALLEFLEHAPAIPGLMTVGSASSRFVPDITVKVVPETERAAYDALEKGSTVSALLTDQPGKERRDEAALAKENAAGNDQVTGDDNAPDDPKTAAPTPPPPLIDLTLQRAVHLHRALKALRKI